MYCGALWVWKRPLPARDDRASAYNHWQYRWLGSDCRRAIEVPARVDQLSSTALLRYWTFRSVYVGATISALSPRARVRADLCGVLLLGHLSGQLEMSALSPTLFPGLFHSQSLWR